MKTGECSRPLLEQVASRGSAVDGRFAGMAKRCCNNTSRNCFGCAAYVFRNSMRHFIDAAAGNGLLAENSVNSAGGSTHFARWRPRVRSIDGPWLGQGPTCRRNHSSHPSDRLAFIDRSAKRPFPSITDAPSVLVSVVVPAYNESKRIDPMMTEMLSFLNGKSKADKAFTWEIVVVDDGSKDNTSEHVYSNYVKKLGGC